jgi:hypothetical protein
MGDSPRPLGIQDRQGLFALISGSLTVPGTNIYASTPRSLELAPVIMFDCGVARIIKIIGRNTRLFGPLQLSTDIPNVFPPLGGGWVGPSPGLSGWIYNSDSQFGIKRKRPGRRENRSVRIGLHVFCAHRP